MFCDDGFVIPISPFDQADCNAAPLFAGPRNYVLQIRFAILEVRLHRQASGGGFGKFRFGEDFLKKLNAARDKTAGAPAALMYGVNLGGPAFTYYALTTFEKFPDREKFPNGRAMLTKVYGEAEANRLLKNEFDAITQFRAKAKLGPFLELAVIA